MVTDQRQVSNGNRLGLTNDEILRVSALALHGSRRLAHPLDTGTLRR